MFGEGPIPRHHDAKRFHNNGCCRRVRRAIARFSCAQIVSVRCLAAVSCAGEDRRGRADKKPVASLGGTGSSGAPQKACSARRRAS